MNITISVSEKTERIIRERAKEKGKEIEGFVEEFVEESFADKHGGEIRERKHNLLTFAGMFSGGDGTVSQRYKQILLDEVDKVAGFTTDKEKH